MSVYDTKIRLTRDWMGDYDEYSSEDARVQIEVRSDEYNPRVIYALLLTEEQMLERVAERKVEEKRPSEPEFEGTWDDALDLLREMVRDFTSEEVLDVSRVVTAELNRRTADMSQLVADRFGSEFEWVDDLVDRYVGFWEKFTNAIDETFVGEEKKE